MNEIVTKTVSYRGKEIPVQQLKENSNIEVIVRCVHGERKVRWARRNQLCKRCAIEAGHFNTSRKDRSVSWGHKISETKKGKKLSEKHKTALSKAHKGKPLSKEHVEAQNRNRRRGKDHPSWKDIPESRKKIRKYLSGAIGNKLKNRDLSKTDSVTLTLPYTIDDLASHIEKQFWPGMSWDNYGLWHIDHVVPDSLFKYETEDDDGFKQSWALENLQPLWGNLNVIKGNKNIRHPIIDVIFLCGQSGVGKTTMCQQLKEKFEIIHYDQCRNLPEAIGCRPLSKPLLVDIPIKISTYIKSLSGFYKIHPIFIIEDVETVRQRVAMRGKSTSNVQRRYDRMVSLSKKYGEFTGNYSEVLDFLNSYSL